MVKKPPFLVEGRPDTLKKGGCFWSRGYLHVPTDRVSRDPSKVWPADVSLQKKWEPSGQSHRFPQGDLWLKKLVPTYSKLSGGPSLGPPERLE